MKNPLRLALLSLLLLTTTAVSQSLAAGFGFYGTYRNGSSTSDWDVEDTICIMGLGCWDEDFEIDVDIENRGFGFVMDTAPAQDRVFNYRLNAGIEKFEVDLEGPELSLAGVILENTFGFRVFRSPDGLVRVWLGPRIRVGLYAGDIEWQYFKDDDVIAATFGVGPVLGANFNIGRHLTVAGTAGWDFAGYGVHVDEFGSRNGLIEYEDMEIDGPGRTFYTGFLLMFRAGGDIR